MLFFHALSSFMPTGLSPNARYDTVMTAFGGKGYYVETKEELGQAFQTCLADVHSPSLINVVINPLAGKKPQVTNIQILDDT